jgi:localization factor PodJL
MSVGEWLNGVIERGDDEDGEPMRSADDYDDDDGWRDDHRPDRRHAPRQRHNRDREREISSEREAAPAREEFDRWGDDHRRDDRPAPRRRLHRDPEGEISSEREAALASEEFGEVHARLDRLTHQLERMARTDATPLTGAPAPHRRPSPPAAHPRPGYRFPASDPAAAVDNAIAEIAERQRALYGDVPAGPPLPAAPSAPIAPSYAPPAPAYVPLAPSPVAPTAEHSPPPAPPPPPQPFSASPRSPSEPPIDLFSLSEQLQYITTRMEAARPGDDLQNVIRALREDLSEIRRQLTEALPRRAVESLESEVQELAQRIDHSRTSGVEPAALAGLENGLAEVRDALHNLTPAENLVGFDDAVKKLAQKIDVIIAKDDPAALQQLETAIGALRGIVSHVASNDTLNKVAEDVRALAAKVDGLANHSALEARLDSLTNALQASTEAGQSVPRELEKMLAGLIEKLEWVQLTHTDHAALGQLEDRIAQLIKRLDASDARLGNLEAVERGLADLLVHMDKIPGDNAAAEPGLKIKLGDVVEIEREVAEIKLSERRVQDSLEAVQGTVEQVVDRLAMIESDMHESSHDTQEDMRSWLPPADGSRDEAADAVPAQPAESAAPPAPASAEPASRKSGAPRPPIDPNLPPDHPLEPGYSGPRQMPSAADRIAASEAAVGYAKPPVIAEPGEKTDYIAAARRAAQAAASAPAERQPRAKFAAISEPQAGKPSRLRKLLVAGGAVLILVGCVHIALRMFQDGGSAVTPAPESEQTLPPAVLPEADQSKEQPSQAGPLVLPVPATPPETAPATTPPPSIAPDSTPGENPAPASPQNPGRQSALPAPDVTGSLPQLVLPPAWPTPDAAPVKAAAAPKTAAPAQASMAAPMVDKLPATIGGPTLRAAAIAGDAAAEFEVAMRFAEGHGVPPSNELAAQWLDRAAKQGLAPAQFRLGGFYEKGIGVKKNLVMARDLYAAAAARGNGKAMHNLAVLYAEGIDGPADYRTASLWFRKAADHGITDSQYNLAILYARGIGVDQNYAESYKWFALGANGGDSDAAKKRDEIASHLDAQSLAAAQSEIQKWTAEPQADDAITVKAPPGGWDPPAQSAKAKLKPAGKTSALDSSKTGL